MSVKVKINGKWVRQASGGSAASGSTGVAFYDINLTDSVSVQSNATQAQEFDILEHVDTESVRAAIDAGRPIRVFFSSTYDDTGSGGLLTLPSETSVVLSDIQINGGHLRLGAVGFRTDLTSYNIRLTIQTADDGTETAKITYYPNPDINNYTSADRAMIDSTLSYSGKAADAYTVGQKLSACAKTINGVAPDADGNIQFEPEILKTTATDYTNWYSGSFVETLSDGTQITHAVTFDESGNVTSVAGITITGMVS